MNTPHQKSGHGKNLMVGNLQVLISRQRERAIHRGRIRSFLCLRPLQNGISNRPFYDGSKTST